MAFWSTDWNIRTYEAEQWLRLNANVHTPAEIGNLIGHYARRQWLDSVQSGHNDDFTRDDPYVLAHFGFSEVDFDHALVAWKNSFGFLRISIDSQIIIDMDRPNYQTTFDKLADLSQRKLLNVSISSRFVQDKNRDQDQARIQRHLSASSTFSQTVSIARCDESLTDADVPTGDDFEEIWKHLARVTNAVPGTKKYDNQRRDGDHLYSHIISNRDYFLTREKIILTNCSTLPPNLAVVAIEPTRFLAALEAAEKDGQSFDGMSPNILEPYLK